jgi:hypothetical protein
MPIEIRIANVGKTSRRGLTSNAEIASWAGTEGYLPDTNFGPITPYTLGRRNVVPFPFREEFCRIGHWGLPAW